MKQLLNVGKHRISGFSIVELMTVVFISALILAVALPSYENFVQNNRSLSMASRLASSLRLAQSEAIKNGIPVTICPISNTFNPTVNFSETIEEWPCQNTNTWDAWKVFTDANFNATEDFSNGWPVIKYIKNSQPSAITSNLAGPITFDPMGFANINPTATRAGWNWNANYDNTSGDWEWSSDYISEYTGSYYRIFSITPEGCTGNNARAIEITQNGIIIITKVAC